MSYGTPYGIAPYGASEEPAGEVIEFQPIVIIEWDGWAEFTPQVQIEWIPEVFTPVIPVQWISLETFTPVVPIQWEGSQTGYPAASEQWTLSVSVGGADLSQRLSGQVSIDYEEDASGLAEFSIIPAVGNIDTMSWLGKSVTIDVTSGGVTKRRFNGIVSNAVYDPDTGIMDFSCTTDLQGYFENADRAHIDSVVGGYWSEHLFNDDGDGWTYAQDRLSTQYASIHQDVNRKIVKTSLNAKSTPDFTFTDSKRFNDTLEISRATRRDLVNRIRLEVDFRYTRLRQRHIHYEFQWSSPYSGRLDWCDFLGNNYELCERAQVESAIDASGWVLQGDIQYLEIPESGYFECPGYFNPNASQAGDQFGWVVNDAVRDSLCLGARWNLSKRFAQTVTEKYIFDVRAENSIAYCGEIGLDRRFALDNEYDASEWESDQAYSGVKSGSAVDASGDYVYDVVDGDSGRSAFNNLQRTALEYAKATMKKSHRENTASFEAPFHSEVNLTHTIRVESGYLTAQGKARQIVDHFNVDTGEAYSEIHIALSLHGGSGLVVDSSLDTVTAEDSTQYPEVETSKKVYYYIGGEQFSQPYDETIPGYYTNRKTITGNYPRYDNQFVFETPAIASAFRSAIELPAESSIKIDIPQDTLMLAA